MTTCLGKSCSFGLPRVPFVNCCHFMYLVISLLVLRSGCGIYLYQFLIIAYLFTLSYFLLTLSLHEFFIILFLSSLFLNLATMLPDFDSLTLFVFFSALSTVTSRSFRSSFNNSFTSFITVSFSLFGKCLTIIIFYWHFSIYHHSFSYIFIFIFEPF